LSRQAADHLTGNHNTVEELLRYAARRFNAAGVGFRPSKMSKLIRSFAPPMDAKAAIDSYLADKVEAASWAGFELYVLGYADPTGAHAARNVDNERRTVISR
jgi:hypothetical protein